MRELVSVRRLHVLLTREGIIMNHKKLRRLYREERLQVRRRGGRKRSLGTRTVSCDQRSIGPTPVRSYLAVRLSLLGVAR